MSSAVVRSWLGVLAAAGVGVLLGVLHAVLCNRPRVNYVAVGIAMMIFGMGLARLPGQAADPAQPRRSCRRFDLGAGASDRAGRVGADASTPCS